MKALSVAQLAIYLSRTKRTIQRRAIKEHWPYEACIGLGGTRHLYTFGALPEEVKTKIIASQAVTVCEHDYIQNTDDSAQWVEAHCFSGKLDTSQLNKAYIQAGLLILVRLYVIHAKLGKIRAFDAFCQLYNTHMLAIDPAIFTVVKHVSRISLLRWGKRGQRVTQT